MPESLKIVLAQVNTTVGDLEGNARLIADWVSRGRDEGADLIVFPELCLPGYPAEDLYLKRHFLAANVAALEGIAAEVAGITALVGFAEPRADAHPDPGFDAPTPRPAHNSVAVLADGAVQCVYRKQRLPNYGVFDEYRYFEPGVEPLVIEVAGTRVGVTICEDMWQPGGAAEAEAASGAELIVNCSGSPYYRGKSRAREELIAARARETGVPIVFCNLVGGQDELVFDGSSFAVTPSGDVVARAAAFAEEALTVELGGDGTLASGRTTSRPEPLGELYDALVLGLGDYVRKNGFEHVVVAVSGGIDSALVALLAADACGGERLTCVVMPSPHSSVATQGDARSIAVNLGGALIELPIAAAMAAYDEALAGHLDGSGAGLAAENLQARIRGNLIMALSNSHGWLVLTTGNKSEMSVGYATLYGDMAGGFAVIKDVPKTVVYALVRHRNGRTGGKPPVPMSVIERPPSAELRPGQLDEDSLPPYDVLDEILAAYVEGDRSRDEIVAGGINAAVVDFVLRLVDRAEYKRRQAPPGIRVTAKAFGRDRRLPITNRYFG